MKAKEKQKTAGMMVAMPSKECNEKTCPFHGSLKVHGRVFKGEVIRDVFHKTVVIEFNRIVPLRKYERFVKQRSRVKAHVPSCMDVHKGDVISVMETRPISKTKNFVVIEGGRQ